MKTCVLLLASLLIGCAGTEPTGSSTELEESEDDQVGATRASREAVAVEATSASAVLPSPVPPSSVVAAPVAPAAPVVPTPLFTAHLVDAARGEDGRGSGVDAVAPVAFDLDAARFPPRAADPVLHVGDLRFTQYTYPEPGVLRFVAADRSALPEGAEVAVQYGDDTASRLVVAPALELP